MKMNDQELEDIITKVNTLFYEKIYEDEWLMQVFKDVEIEAITAQQTDFILGVMGGPKRYCGRSPKDAHPHIFIEEDMWLLREKYLKEAFVQTNTPQWLVDKWLRVDEAFKNAIIKNSVDECFGRYKTEEIINIPNPDKYKKAA